MSERTSSTIFSAAWDISCKTNVQNGRDRGRVTGKRSVLAKKCMLWCAVPAPLKDFYSCDVLLHYKSVSMLRCIFTQTRMHTHATQTYTSTNTKGWPEPYIYAVRIRCIWQEKHPIYGHRRCIYTVLANLTNTPTLQLNLAPSHLHLVIFARCFTALAQVTRALTHHRVKGLPKVL